MRVPVNLSHIFLALALHQTSLLNVNCILEKGFCNLKNSLERTLPHVTKKHAAAFFAKKNSQTFNRLRVRVHLNRAIASSRICFYIG
jgi:hypothetical protein